MLNRSDINMWYSSEKYLAALETVKVRQKKIPSLKPRSGFQDISDLIDKN